MKLRNKQTGEIVDFMIHKYAELSDDGNPVYAAFNGGINDWEDVPEGPKGYWYMSNRGDIRFIEDEDTDWDNDRKQIGNYFGTKEEAELAVRKLKAWKRLKDKGFRFEGRYKPNYGEKFIIECSFPKETLVIDVANDLDLLFSQENGNV